MNHFLVSRTSITNAKVLIVDDDQFQRLVLRQILSDSGFTQFREAEDGQTALDITREWEPDLLLLDINMPGMSGLDVCTTLKEEERHLNTVIIMQTAVSETDLKAKAFDAGITDFITKPLDPREVIARVMAHLERKILKAELQQDHQRLQDELKEAMLLQNILLPTQKTLGEIREDQQLDISYYYHPCSELAGDYLAIKKLTKSRSIILAADISGHGVTAALYTFVFQSLFNEYNQDGLQCGELLEKMNKTLFSLMETGKFATAFACIIDTNTDTLEYSAAACPSPILFSNGKTSILDTKALLLGVTAEAKYSTHVLPFKKGDMLCFYSDALLETHSGNEMAFTEESLADYLASNTTYSASKTSQSIITKFFTSITEKASDDISLLVCKHN